MLNSSNFAMIPLSYCIHLASSGQREKMRWFTEYCIDFAIGRTNSIRFYAQSWNIGKTKAGKLCKEFKQEIIEFHKARIKENEKHFEKIVDKMRTGNGQKSDTKTDAKTTVKSGTDEGSADTKTDNFSRKCGHNSEKIRTKKIERKKEIKKNTHTILLESVCVELNLKEAELEEWLNEKSAHADDRGAYKYALERALVNGTKRTIEELKDWKKKKDQQQQVQQLEEVEQIESADFSIFTQNPQILEHFLNFNEKIKYVIDSQGFTLDIWFENGQRTNIAKSQLYPLLKELQQGGAV